MKTQNEDWQGEEFFSSGDAYFSAVIAAINSAKHSVDFESYIFEKGELANRLMGAMAIAVNRGVKVRLMVDGFGSYDFVSAFAKALEGSGVIVKVFHPIPWNFSNYTVSGHWVPGTLFQLFGSMNRRNHRKVCLIDGQEAFVGSLNVSDWHLESVKGVRAWRDYGVRVKGNAIRLLEDAFNRAWEGWLGQAKGALRVIKNVLELRHYYRYFLLNHTLMQRRRTHVRLLRRIKRSRKRVWMVTPYFVPNFRLLRGLAKASARGVDVRLMLPQHNDVTFMHWVMKTFYAPLLAKGIHIYEYMPSVLHAKAALIDDWAFVGSSNLNSRSLFHDLEANVVLHSHDCKTRLENTMIEDMEHSVEVKDAAFVNVFERLLGRLLLLMKYWI